VTLFTSRPQGALPLEHDQGVRIERRGGAISLYLYAAWYLLRNRRRFDAVIDCQNGIPFFTPLFAHRWAAVVCAIHHVHQDQFGVHFRWPLSAIGRVLERRVSRRVYGKRPLVAVSPSTRAAVRRRLGLRGPIYIVPNGAPPAVESVATRRSASPSIVCVGRLVAHKRMDLLLGALPHLLASRPELRLEIAGEGPDRPRLEQLARDLGVEHAVRFHGYVSAAGKAQLLASAWLTVNPSMGEGWGLGVIEANAHGVPAVACRVPGLSDSVRPGLTGWLVDDEHALPAGIERALEVLADPAEGEAWAGRCRQWASQFSWESSARRLAGVVCAELTRPKKERRRANRTDLATVAEFEVDDPEAFSRLAAGRLRQTDLWSIAGNRVCLLLHGADEADTHGVLERLGVRGPADVRVAVSYELLVGLVAEVGSWPARPEAVAVEAGATP
jgi:glycosyltransferase involved in cell wall biosynthesis